MRNQNPKITYMNIAKTRTPEMRYNDKEDFWQWQKDARAKLRDLLGLDLLEKCDFDYLKEEVTETEEYTQIRFSFQSEPGYYVPAYIRIPKNYEGKLKPMICLQGHSKGMHISLGIPKFPGDEESINGGDRNFATSALANGYCPVIMEQRFMGECGGTDKGPSCHTGWDIEYKMSVLSSLALGIPAIGLRVWDVSRMIDVLAENFGDILDMDNVYCMGNSGGGTATFYAACVDERIKACMPSCAICTYRHSIIGLKHCPCNYIQGVARYFDMGDLAGLIAPRKLVAVSGQLDHGFPIEGAAECMDIAKKLYTYAGCPENVTHVVGELGHRFYAEKGYKAFNEMVK